MSPRTASLTAHPPSSIYARTTPLTPLDPEARDARRARARARIASQPSERPSLSLDRVAPMRGVLSRIEHEGASLELLEVHVERVRREVEDLERWVRGRGARDRAEGGTIRRALELLRGFGRIVALDYGAIPDDRRGALVAWLALEHRWCYAAAGTDRETFKRCTGRSGAR